MGKKRKMPGLNTSSTADISFMLLIFFLVTTSMDTDQGLARTLPKPPEDDQLNNEIKVKERNILNIRINKDNYLLIGDDYASLADVKERAKEFIKNADNKPNLPELKPKKIKGLGKTMMVTENHVISSSPFRQTVVLPTEYISLCRMHWYRLTTSFVTNWPKKNLVTSTST